jgi:hypothetical protein
LKPVVFPRTIALLRIPIHCLELAKKRNNLLKHKQFGYESIFIDLLLKYFRHRYYTLLKYFRSRYYSIAWFGISFKCKRMRLNVLVCIRVFWYDPQTHLLVWYDSCVRPKYLSLIHYPNHLVWKHKSNIAWYFYVKIPSLP